MSEKYPEDYKHSIKWMNRKQMENGPFPILSDVFHIERKQSNLGGGLCFVLDH